MPMTRNDPNAFDPSTGGWGMSAAPTGYDPGQQMKGQYPTLGDIGTGQNDLWGMKKQPQLGYQQGGDLSGGNMPLPGLPTGSGDPMDALSNAGIKDQSQFNAATGATGMPPISIDPVPPGGIPPDPTGGTPSIGMPPVAPGEGGVGGFPPPQPPHGDPFPPPAPGSLFGTGPSTPGGYKDPSQNQDFSQWGPMNNGINLPGIDQPSGTAPSSQAGYKPPQQPGWGGGAMTGGKSIWGDSSQPYAGFAGKSPFRRGRMGY